MERDEIIKHIKFAQECVADVSDPELKKIAFEVVLSVLMDGRSTSHREVVSPTVPRQEVPRTDVSEVWARLARDLELPVDSLQAAIKLQDEGEWSLNLAHFGNESDTSKKECKAAIIILALNKIITGNDSMLSTQLGARLNEIHLKTYNSSDNIKNNAKTEDGKNGVYVKGAGRATQYTINPVGMQLAKAWLKELI